MRQGDSPDLHKAIDSYPPAFATNATLDSRFKQSDSKAISGAAVQELTATEFFVDIDLDSSITNLFTFLYLR
jgi:hypothetical protein